MHRHTLTWVAIFGTITLMFLRLPPMVAKQDSIVHTYGALVEVDALAKRNFVEPVRSERLVEGAIRGMLLKLDPYSGYIAPRELPAFERRSEGDFSGVGVELGVEGGRITVIAPVEGSPAAAAGVRPGDVIIAVDGRDVDGRSVFDVEERLIGRPSSTVRLKLQHRGEQEPIEKVMRRDHVTLRTIRGFRRSPDGHWDYMVDSAARIGYVRVTSFRHNTMRDFDETLADLRAKGARALVLDLRFNPGGLMQPGIEMVDRFLTDGLILSTVTRRQAIDEFPARAEGTIDDMEVVILTNGGSASSAEIVAGSLQARGRAKVVGERTFGKGSVQHLIHLTDHAAAIKLTVAYYRLPNGRIIHRTEANAETQAWGVIPDVVVPLSQTEAREIVDARRALDLAYLDPQDEGNQADGESCKHLAKCPAAEPLIDTQLREALHILKRSLVGDMTGSP